MAPIGPQLPPSLSKRKRTPEDDARAESPPSKIRASEPASGNKDEIAYDEDSSDDDYGPSTAPSVPSVGPTQPPSNGASHQPSRSAGPTTNQDEISLEDDEDDESNNYGPSAPQTTVPSKVAPSRPNRPSPSPIGPTLPPSDTQPSRPKHIYGPAPPPASLSERPPDPASDSDSDSDYGPALPTSSTQQARHTAALAAQAHSSANPKAPQRDDWMLAPPTAHGYRAPDPTKLKNRKFNSGPRYGGGGSGAGGAAGEISSIWTETPEQKRRRLENAVLGRDEGSSDAQITASSGNSRRMRDEDERTERIRSNLEASRGASLYDEHQRREGGKGGRIEQEEDDPSKRAFDREKDMKLGGHIGTKQRRELMNKAADFGGRFTKGRYL